MSKPENNKSTIFPSEENKSTIFGNDTSLDVKPKKKALAGGIIAGSTLTTIIVLAVVMVILIATLVTLIFVFRDNGEEKDPPKFDIWEGESSIGNAAHLAYPLIEESSVTKIDVYREGEEFSLIKHWLEDSGTYDWRIEGTEKMDLNATNFELIRMWVCQVTTKSPIRNATSEEIKTYGVDKEKHNGYTVYFEENGQQKSYTVRVGEKSSSKDNVYYAYIEGRNHIYKINANAVKQLSYEKYEYLSPVINTFFAGETQALMGIDRFDIYLTNGSNTALNDVVSIKVDERGETTVEFKAIYGIDALGRRRTTIASTTHASSVFATLYTSFAGERVMIVDPSDEKLKEYGLAPEQEKYFINVEFAENATFKSPTYKNLEPSLFVSRNIDGFHYVLSEYFGQRAVVKVAASSLSFLGEGTDKLIKWTDTNSIKTGFYEAITETETDPGLEKLVLKTPNGEETFVFNYDKVNDILTVTGTQSGLVFKDDKSAESSFTKNRFRNLYVYLLYFPFINSFNDMTDEKTQEYIKSENLAYSITAYRNDSKVIKYSYYSTSASLAIERVEEGTITGDGVSWGTPTYGNICAMEEIRTVTKAIDKLLAGEELLPDEDILG
jgi:hypothetical protein